MILWQFVDVTPHEPLPAGFFLGMQDFVEEFPRGPMAEIPKKN